MMLRIAFQILGTFGTLETLETLETLKTLEILVKIEIPKAVINLKRVVEIGAYETLKTLETH